MGTDKVWWSVCGNRTEDRDAFWDHQLTVNTSDPDLTRCFQQTVLLWIPCGYLALCLPFYGLYLSRRPWIHTRYQRSKLNILKIVFGMLLTVVAMVHLVCVIREACKQAYVPPVEFITATTKVLTFLAVTGLIALEYQKGIHCSGVLIVFWLLLTLGGIIQLRWYIRHTTKSKEEFGIISFTTFSAGFALLVLHLILSSVTDISAMLPSQPNEKSTSIYKGEEEPLLGHTRGRPSARKRLNYDSVSDIPPEARASFWSNILYLWFSMLLVTGYSRTLKPEDGYDLLAEDKSDTVVPKFESHWKYELHKAGLNGFQNIPVDWPRGKPSLALAMLKTILWPLTVSFILKVVTIGLDFINPHLLRFLLVYISTDHQFLWQGMVLSLSFLLVNLVKAITYQAHQKFANYCGQRLRMTVITSVYRKSLRLSSAARKQVTRGELINAIGVDAEKLQVATQFFAHCYATLPILVLALYFMWGTIGPSSLAALGVVVIVVPFNVCYVGRKVASLQRTQMKQKDVRIKLTNEILTGIKMLKLYAWENKFEEKVLDSRNQELGYVQTAAYLNALSTTSFSSIANLMVLVIYAVYTLTSPRHLLDADKAFVTVTLVNLLMHPVSMLPLAVSFIAQCYVSTKRLSRILLLEEIDPNVVIQDPYKNSAISVYEGTFSWGRDGQPVLHSISLDIKPGSLVAIVGLVGSGKSSLMASLLGGLHKRQGSVTINGSTAYVPQQAWIQNATLKDNILFGRHYDQHYYRKVLDACALLPDLAILPGADMTEIGAKGINISGGQKQRISLARAVYSCRDIYLVDDPLSAVDAHVSKHIFDHVIGPSGLLAGCTRVLVTHSVNYLPQCDKIIVLVNGRVSEIGTYGHLLAGNGEFAKFIRHYGNGDDRKEAQSPGGVVSPKQTKVTSPMTAADIISPTMMKNRLMRRKPSVVVEVSTSIGSPVRPGARLLQEETSATGKIQWSVMHKYLQSIGFGVLALICVSLALFTAVSTYTSIWLSDWTSDLPVNGTFQDRAKTEFRITVYGLLVAAKVVTLLVPILLLSYGCVKASRVLHIELLNRILHAPMSFFDTTPLGSIINRFTKDMDSIDVTIPVWLRMWLTIATPVVSAAIIISYTTPWFLTVLPPIAIMCHIIQKLYVCSVRQLKRMDSVLRSPIYGHLAETMAGVTTIRAYNQQSRFIATNDFLTNRSQKLTYNLNIAQRWMSLYLEILSSFIVFFASLFAVLAGPRLTPGMAGMALSYALRMTSVLTILVRTTAELEAYIIAVERIKEYIEIPTEAPRDIPENKPPPDWPAAGDITFHKYCTRYRPGLDLVLNDVSCNIKSGERIAIVGRTGAGKSSMTLALFRLIEATAGEITIDNIQISNLGLHDLRARMTVIPQDPVIFSGSLRDNLDPFHRYPDTDIWRALEQAHLKSHVQALESGLDSTCGEEVVSLSVGQCQLLCLARALLRRTRILVLDEATAAVDLETDDLIQQIIHSQFSNCTVITIAHRLNTVMDYHRVLVMDQGVIKEFDSPSTLLQSKDSLFSAMIRDAGLST